MKVWIDTATGTWGTLDMASLVIVDLDAVAQDDVRGGDKPGHDAYSLIAALDTMSDSEINEFGTMHGTPIKDTP